MSELKAETACRWSPLHRKDALAGGFADILASHKIVDLIPGDPEFVLVLRARITAIVITVVGAILALSAANYVGVYFIIRPIERIVHVLRRWAEGDLAARTNMAGAHGEVGQVGAPIDELLNELGRRAENARNAEQQRIRCPENWPTGSRIQWRSSRLLRNRPSNVRATPLNSLPSPSV